MPGLTVNLVRGPRVDGTGLMWASADVTFDSSYPLGGESLTAADFNFDDVEPYAQIIKLIADPVGHNRFEYDYTNHKLKARRNSLGLSEKTIGIKHSATAATAGVATYAHIDETFEQGTFLAHIEAVAAGTADGYHAVSNGGAVVRIQHDAAAATGGNQIYVDEDSTQGLRVIADIDNIAGNRDVFVMVSDGTFLKVTDIDNPATPGVALYWDDDATNDYARFMFVSPTTTDGSCRLWEYGGEVPEATDLSTVTTRVIAWAAK